MEKRARLSYWRKSGITAGTAMLIALPWIFVISAKYNRITISTSGPIAHAIAGPLDVDRYHPTFVTLHRPGKGRITSWEDPTNMGYRHWSPFDSPASFRHQLSLGTGNTLRVLFILTTLLPLWPWVIWRAVRLGRSNAAFALGGLPVVLLGGLYLPFYLTANEQRYFFVAVPLLWAALAITREAESGSSAGLRRSGRVLWLNAGLIALLLVASMIRFSVPPRTASREARLLADWLRQQDMSGPVAGSALQRGGRTGLFLAWYLREPWLGDDQSAPPASFLGRDVRFVVLVQSDPRIDALAKLPEVAPLSPPPGIAPQVMLFEVRPPD
jgi:hypothetical protein